MQQSIFSLTMCIQWSQVFEENLDARRKQLCGQTYSSDRHAHDSTPAVDFEYSREFPPAVDFEHSREFLILVGGVGNNVPTMEILRLWNHWKWFPLIEGFIYFFKAQFWAKEKLSVWR